jgi:hypothetical protein
LKKILFIQIVLSFLSILGCAKDDPVAPSPLPTSPSFHGTWIDNGIPITLTLIEDNGKITGAGYLFNYYSLSVQGEILYPDITFSIGTAGFIPATFSGSLKAEDTLSGTLNGNIFRNQSVVLTREP